MNLNKACECLSISPDDIHIISEKELKHTYRKMALKYHPDKCKLKDATERFQEIQESYEVICAQRLIIPESTDYRSLLILYLRHYFPEPEWIVELLLKGLNMTFYACMHKIDKSQLTLLYTFLNEHKSIFHIPEDVLQKIYNMISNDNEPIKIGCSLSDLFEQKIYMLNVDKDVKYVPLWHDEIEYTVGDKEIIVLCDCTTEENVEIDIENNVHIIVRKVLTRNMLLQDEWEYKLDGVGVYRIEQRIEPKKYQKFVLQEKGIPMINEIDIFDVTKLSDIVIHLYLDLS